MNIHDATEVAYKNGYERGKTDTAKKIFAEIESSLVVLSDSGESYCIIRTEDYLHYKKKYLEGEDND